MFDIYWFIQSSHIAQIMQNKSFKYESYFTNSDTNGKLIKESLPSK